MSGGTAFARLLLIKEIHRGLLSLQYMHSNVLFINVPIEVVPGSTSVHHLHSATRQPEGHGPQR